MTKTLKDIFAFLSSDVGRGLIKEEPLCPVEISSAGVLRVRGKSKNFPGARKEDVVKWASANVPDFHEWFASKADDSDSDSEFYQAESEAVSSEHPIRSESKAVSSEHPIRSVSSEHPIRSESKAVSSEPLFPENKKIRTQGFYDWLVRFGFIYYDETTGDFSFETIPAAGLHQVAAKELGFNIGRAFTVADCKKAAARHWGLPKEVRVPKRGNLHNLRHQASLKGEALEAALMLERAQARFADIKL